MKNYLFSYLTSVILVLSGVLYAQGSQEENKNNLFVIDDQTTISFSIPEDRYFYSKLVEENINLLDLKDIKFYSFEDFLGFEAYQFYIKKIRIKNKSIARKRISVISGEPHIRSEFFLISGDNFKSFVNHSGGRNVNSLASINPGKVSEQSSKLRNFTFDIEPGQVLDLYYKYLTPNKTNFIRDSLNFYHTEKYQESRRFGLWLEGIIFGSLLALAIFTFYSYSQIKDTTTLYFGLWLVTAMGAVIGQNTHDGTRLFEFIVPPLRKIHFLILPFLPRLRRLLVTAKQ